jgi:hypothetical protein
VVYSIFANLNEIHMDQAVPKISLYKTKEEGVVEPYKVAPFFVLNCRLPFRQNFPRLG